VAEAAVEEKGPWEGAPPLSRPPGQQDAPRVRRGREHDGRTEAKKQGGDEVERREHLGEAYELAEHCRFIATQLEDCLGRAQRRLLAILKAVAQSAPQHWAIWLRGNLELVGDSLLEAEDQVKLLKRKAQELVELQEGLLRG
jgi:hypothetical protein